MCIYWSMLHGCRHPKGKEEEPTADWTCEDACPYYQKDILFKGEANMEVKAGTIERQKTLLKHGINE